MTSYLFYFLQVVMCSGILYGYYFIVLRNKKFHLYNRYYLLIAAMISIAIPILNIPVYFEPKTDYSSPVIQALTVFSAEKVQTTIASRNSIANAHSSFSWVNLFEIFYAVAAFSFFIRFLIAIRHINKLTKSYVAERIDHIYFFNTNEPGTPFAFFKWLFWNTKIELNSERGEQIFRHEIFHIRQKHSLDIILFELLTIAFWLNPFFHLFKKEIKAIHEFLADEFAIKENEEWDYAELLLMQVLESRNHLLNPFFHNQIKRRIAMITSSKRPGYQYLRKIMVLPVAAVVIALFAFKYKEIKSKSQSRINLQDAITQESKEISTLSDTAKFTNVDNAVTSFNGVAIKDKNIKMASIPAVPLGRMKYEYKDSSKPLDGVLFVIDGKERADIKSLSGIDSIIKPNEISSINVLKGASAIAKYGEKGKNGVLEIITKDSPQTDIPKPIFSLPGIDIRANSVVIKDPSFNTQNSTIIPNLIIFNNKGYSAVDFYRVVVGYGRIEAKLAIIIPPNNWESIEKYGDRAKNGVIIFEEGKKVDVRPEIKSADVKKATLTSLLRLPPNAKVISCLFSIDTEKGTILDSFNSGNDFSASTANLIQTAAPGKLMTIDDIIIEKDGGCKRVASLMYYIID